MLFALAAVVALAVPKFLGERLGAPDALDSALTVIGRILIAIAIGWMVTTIIDALIAAEDRGDVLSESELVACCVLLLFAGHETTTNLFGSGLHALFRHPEVHRDLRSAPEKAEAAVEEFLRYNGPIGAMTRIVAAPCRYGERDLKPGQRVFCMIHAANRDPARTTKQLPTGWTRSSKPPSASPGL